MLKPLYIAVLLWPVLMVVGCGGSARGPVAELETDEFDFGLIRTDEFAEATFTIYNKGDKTLKLRDLTTSCSCTTGELLDERIPPGGKGQVLIQVNPNKMMGASTRMSLGIQTNDPAHEMLVLPVKARLEFPLRFATDVDAPGDTRVIAGIFASTNSHIPHRAIPQGVPTVILVRAIQRRNQFVSAEPTAGQTFKFEQGEITVSAEIAPAPAAQWTDPDIKEFDLKFTFLADVPPGDYEVAVRLHTNIRRYMFYNLTFDLTVVDPSTYTASMVSLAESDTAAPEEIPVTGTALHLVSILKESDASYAARIATGTSERWYNEGAEFEGYVLENIYHVQNAVIIRERSTGHRLRVIKTDAESSTVTLMP